MTNKDTAAEETTAGEAPARAGLDVWIAQELIDQARAQGVSLVGPGGLLTQITRTVLQTALEAEMSEHLGYEKGDPVGRGQGTPNTRVAAELGVSRDMVGKWRSRFHGQAPGGVVRRAPARSAAQGD